jgi:hypothetical protein
MKTKLFAFVLMMGGLVMSIQLNAQDAVTGKRLSREEKKALKESGDQVKINEVNKLISGPGFVLETNQVSGYQVDPVLNFILISGDTLAFQTSTGFYKSNNPLADKTVMGKITTRKVTTDKKTGYNRINLQAMTEIGKGFRVDIKVSPGGNAVAWVSANNSSGQLEYRGRILSFDDANISVGPESFDLDGFPWFSNTLLKSYQDR